MRRGGSAHHPHGRVSPGTTLPTGALQHPEHGAGTWERHGSQSYGREALGSGLNGGGYPDYDSGHQHRSSSREGRPQGWYLGLLSCRGFRCRPQSPVVHAQLSWPRSGTGLRVRLADSQLAPASPTLRVFLLCTSGLQHSNSYRGTEGYDLGSRRSGSWRDVDGPQLTSQSPVRSHSYGAFERRGSESNSHQHVSSCWGVRKRSPSGIRATELHASQLSAGNLREKQLGASCRFCICRHGVVCQMPTDCPAHSSLSCVLFCSPRQSSSTAYSPSQQPPGP